VIVQINREDRIDFLEHNRRAFGRSLQKMEKLLIVPFEIAIIEKSTFFIRNAELDDAHRISPTWAG